MNAFARFMERFWAALAIGSAVWALYVTISRGWAIGKMWWWFPLVCLAMWWYRRFTRRKMAEWEARRRQ